MPDNSEDNPDQNARRRSGRITTYRRRDDAPRTVAETLAQRQSETHSPPPDSPSPEDDSEVEIVGGNTGTPSRCYLELHF